MIPTMRRHAALALAVTLTIAGTSACAGDAVGCTPTQTAAVDADKVDLSAVSQSSTLSATLTSGGTGLGGESLRFAVLDDGAQVYVIDGVTGADGTARVDVKQLDVSALQAVVRGNSFRAGFEGDSTYCSSADDAAFKVVGDAPAGVSLPVP